MRNWLAQVLLLTSLAVTCLSTAPPSRAQCATAIGIGTPVASMVPGNAFQAVRTTTMIRPPHSQFSEPLPIPPETVARDSQGRVRSDRVGGDIQIYSGANAGTMVQQHLVTLCDPVLGEMIHFDTASRSGTLIRMPLWSASRTRGSAPSTFCRMPRLPTNSLRNVDVEDLGHRVIEGFDAVGWRVTMQNRVANATPAATMQRITEDWCSEDLKAILLQDVTGPAGGSKQEIALTQIQRVEPDYSLFEIPSDYTITERVLRSRALSGSAGQLQPPPSATH